MNNRDPLYHRHGPREGRSPRRPPQQGHDKGPAGPAVPPSELDLPVRPCSQPPPEARRPAREKSPPFSVATHAKSTNKVNKVRVLLLTFEYHDLRPGLDEETTLVSNAFESLWGHDGVVSPFTIRMCNYRAGLRQRLKEFLPSSEHPRAGSDTLYVIYYHGHGGRDAEGKFVLSSHKSPERLGERLINFWDDIEKSRAAAARRRGRGAKEWLEDWTHLPPAVAERYEELQPRAEIVWDRDVNDLIMDAGCDTLTILDCCDAGLAAVSDRGLYRRDFATDPVDVRSDFRKELLGACSWGNETADHMSASLVKVLTMAQELARAGDVVSVSTLVRMINIDLAGKTGVVPQAVHYSLRRTGRDPILLPRLVPQPQA